MKQFEFTEKRCLKKWTGFNCSVDQASIFATNKYGKKVVVYVVYKIGALVTNQNMT